MGRARNKTAQTSPPASETSPPASAPEEEPKYKRPTAREAAMLTAHLLEEKQKEVEPTKITRARLSELTLRRLWCRTRINDELFVEVQEELLRLGWVLFWAGSAYAVIKVDAVEGWGQISSKRLADTLMLIDRGQFNFESLEYLLLPRGIDVTDEKEEDN